MAEPIDPEAVRTFLASPEGRCLADPATLGPSWNEANDTLRCRIRNAFMAGWEARDRSSKA